VLATTRVGESQEAQRRPGLLGWLLMTPMLLWLVRFVILPTAILLVFSFASAMSSEGSSIASRGELTNASLSIRIRASLERRISRYFLCQLSTRQSTRRFVWWWLSRGLVHRRAPEKIATFS